MIGDEYVWTLEILFTAALDSQLDMYQLAMESNSELTLMAYDTHINPMTKL